MKYFVLRLFSLVAFLSLVVTGACKKAPEKEKPGEEIVEPSDGGQQEENQDNLTTLDAIGIYSSDLAPILLFDPEVHELRFKSRENLMIVQDRSLALVYSLGLVPDSSRPGFFTATLNSSAAGIEPGSFSVKEVKKEGEMVWLRAEDGSKCLIGFTQPSGQQDAFPFRNNTLKLSSPGGDAVPFDGGISPMPVEDVSM